MLDRTYNALGLEVADDVRLFLEEEEIYHQQRDPKSSFGFDPKADRAEEEEEEKQRQESCEVS